MYEHISEIPLAALRLQTTRLTVIAQQNKGWLVIMAAIVTGVCLLHSRNRFLIDTFTTDTFSTKWPAQHTKIWNPGQLCIALMHHHNSVTCTVTDFFLRPCGACCKGAMAIGDVSVQQLTCTLSFPFLLSFLLSSFGTTWYVVSLWKLITNKPLPSFFLC